MSEMHIKSVSLKILQDSFDISVTRAHKLICGVLLLPVTDARKYREERYGIFVEVFPEMVYHYP